MKPRTLPIPVLTLLTLLLVSCAGSASKIDAPDTMTVESAEFIDGGTMLAQFSCDGEDVSPSLSWGGAPEGTESFAVIVDDPDAPGTTFVHWVYYNIPADVTTLPAKVAQTERPASGGVQGRNGFGELGYRGPCPPSGTHRYYFTILAIDTTLDLEPGATKGALLESASGHILAKGSLMGRYASQ